MNYTDLFTLLTKKNTATVSSVLLFLFRRRPARLNHLLHQIEPDPGLGLVLGQREEVREVEVSGVGCVRVPVLVGGPVELGGVGVAGAHVLGLEVLKLAVDVVALAHREELGGGDGGADNVGRNGRVTRVCLHEGAFVGL